MCLAISGVATVYIHRFANRSEVKKNDPTSLSLALVDQDRHGSGVNRYCVSRVWENIG